MSGISIKINQGEELQDTPVLFKTTDSISVRCVKIQEGYEVTFDTVFSPSSVHEHRDLQVCSKYIDGIAYIPNESDNPIPGTISVFLDGVLINPLFFDEVKDTDGKIVGVKISDTYEIDYNDSYVCFNYLVKPSTRKDLTEYKNAKPIFQNKMEVTLNSSHFADNEQNVCKVAMPADFDPNLAFVFVCNDLPSKGSKVLYTYNVDWDTVVENNVYYLRWRYCPEDEITDAVSARYDLLVSNGIYKFASFELIPGNSFSILY